LSFPRWAYARRSCECAFLHRIRRCSSGRRTPFHAPGAGGVSPPCNTFRMRTRNGQTHLIAFADAVCNPRRAYVRGADESARNCNRVILTPTAGLRPPLLRMCVSASQKTLFLRQTNAVPCTRSGGRKPPVQYLPHANSKRANSPHCRRRRGLQPTAGLRPPLLRMCVSASRIALYAANTRRATKSGWREPAVGSITSLQLENARFCQHPCAPTRAAGVGQPWYGQRMCGAKRKRCET
jgi:hypothetical protein